MDVPQHWCGGSETRGDRDLALARGGEEKSYCDTTRPSLQLARVNKPTKHACNAVKASYRWRDSLELYRSINDNTGITKINLTGLNTQPQERANKNIENIALSSARGGPQKNEKKDCDIPHIVYKLSIRIRARDYPHQHVVSSRWFQLYTCVALRAICRVSQQYGEGRTISCLTPPCMAPM